MLNREDQSYIGAIYDFDDTLLNNQHPDFYPYNLHAHSRYAAVHAVASEEGIAELSAVTHQQNWDAFLDAPEHSVEGAVWLLLMQSGLVTEGPIDKKHELVAKIVQRKSELHMEILERYGTEVNGASNFVRALGGISIPQAIASGARHAEIDVFIDKYGLGKYLPKERIIAKGDYEHPKPHPQSFELAFRTLGLADTTRTRRRVLAFEDDPKGVIAARAAFLSVCVLTTRFPKERFTDQAEADIIISGFDDPALLALFDMTTGRTADRQPI